MYNPETEPSPLKPGEKPARQKLIVRFPAPIKQVDRDKVEIELHPGPSPFTDQFMSETRQIMGINAGEAFLEQMENHILLKTILSGVR